MPKSILTALTAAAILLCGPALAQQGQPQCDERETVLEILRQSYGESPVAMGVTANGGLLEVLTTDSGSTWSILTTTPQGMSCLVATGEGWRGVTAASDDPEA